MMRLGSSFFLSKLKIDLIPLQRRACANRSSWEQIRQPVVADTQIDKSTFSDFILLLYCFRHKCDDALCIYLFYSCCYLIVALSTSSLLDQVANIPELK